MSVPQPYRLTAIACVVKEVDKKKTVFAYYQDTQGDLARSKHGHKGGNLIGKPIDRMGYGTPLAACYFDNEIFIFAKNTDDISYQKIPIPRHLGQSKDTSKLAACNNPSGQAWVYFESIDPPQRTIMEKAFKGSPPEDEVRELEIAPVRLSNLAASADSIVPRHTLYPERSIFYEKEDGIYRTRMTDQGDDKEECIIPDGCYAEHTSLASVYFEGHPRLYFFNRQGELVRTSHIGDGEWQTPVLLLPDGQRARDGSALGAAVESLDERTQIVIYYQKPMGELDYIHDK